MVSKLWSQQVVGFSKEGSLERVRVYDGFHTPLIAVDTLLKVEKFHYNIWEPANGFNRISKPLREYGYNVYTSDIHPWSKQTQSIIGFEDCRRLPKPFREEGADIITNPPFKLASMFVQQGMKLLPKGRKIALLLRLQFVEGNRRYAELFSKTPPMRVHVYSFRLPRMRRFLYHGPDTGSVLCFAWMVWKVGYKGPTELRWIGRKED